MNDRITLTRLPAELREFTGTADPPSYTICYRAILDGRVPAEKTAAGRWMIRRNDLPAIARTLGLVEG